MFNVKKIIPLAFLLERESFSLQELSNQLINLTKKAKIKQEVPVASMVCQKESNGENYYILSVSSNRIYNKKNPTAHSEMLALQKACHKKKTERLVDCILLTTLEPCLMCSGAIILSRLKSVYFIASSHKSPGLRWIINESRKKKIRLNHHPLLYQINEKEKEYQQILSSFFKERR